MPCVAPAVHFQSGPHCWQFSDPLCATDSTILAATDCSHPGMPVPQQQFKRCRWLLPTLIWLQVTIQRLEKEVEDLRSSAQNDIAASASHRYLPACLPASACVRVFPAMSGLHSRGLLATHLCQ